MRLDSHKRFSNQYYFLNTYFSPLLSLLPASFATVFMCDFYPFTATSGREALVPFTMYRRLFCYGKKGSVSGVLYLETPSVVHNKPCSKQLFSICVC